MAWLFGDGFDLYATITDAGVGYWDVAGLGNIVAGRFAGSQGWQNPNGSGVMFAKSSNVNDAVHHFVFSFRQTTAFSGTNVVYYFQLLDGITGQCCVVFRSDGAILLTSGTPAGTVLATYTGGVPSNNTWYGFEFEIVIHPTAGSFTVRRNGNTVNDFTATSLNTRPGTNTYANKLQIGTNTASSAYAQQIDDMLWRSDAASLAWLGDIRCYTRMPGSDVIVQFAKAPPSIGTGQTNTTTTTSYPTGTVLYNSFTPTITGILSTYSISFSPGFTGNCKMSLFSDNAGVPNTIIASATTIVNPVGGYNIFTFPTLPLVTKSTPYWIGISHDVTAVINGFSSSPTCRSGTTVSYASFPVAAPSTSGAAILAGWNAVVNYVNNADLVSEPIQDGTTTYVYDSTVGHADFYNLQPLSGTPASVIAVTTRAFMEKSDAGARSGAVQLKSGATTVASSTVNLSTNFGWVWRTDVNDPNTGTAWTPAAVNTVQIGPIVIA